MMSSCKKGTYCLHICSRRKVQTRVGKLGTIGFEPGHYLYIGSALSGLESRIQRHARKEKSLFWHIDYITSHKNFSIRGAYIIDNGSRLECRKAGQLQRLLPAVSGFGSSDCSCSGHLFFAGSDGDAPGRIDDMMHAVGFEKYDIDKKFRQTYATGKTS